MARDLSTRGTLDIDLYRELSLAAAQDAALRPGNGHPHRPHLATPLAAHPAPPPAES